MDTEWTPQRTLLAPWPVERPNDQPLPDHVRGLVGAGFMYVEDAGHGWNRIGLTRDGQQAAQALRALEGAS